MSDKGRPRTRVNPFPPLFLLDEKKISDRSPTPPWAAADRYCGTVGRIRIDTNYNRPTLATARRPTDHQRLSSAPKSRPVESTRMMMVCGDANDARERPSESARLTGH